MSLIGWSSGTTHVIMLSNSIFKYALLKIVSEKCHIMVFLTKGKIEWVCDRCLQSIELLSAIAWLKQFPYWWGGNDIYFALEQRYCFIVLTQWYNRRSQVHRSTPITLFWLTSLCISDSFNAAYLPTNTHLVFGLTILVINFTRTYKKIQSKLTFYLSDCVRICRNSTKYIKCDSDEIRTINDVIYTSPSKQPTSCFL